MATAAPRSRRGLESRSYPPTCMVTRRGARRVQPGALWAFVPVVGMLPFTLLALVVFWLPITVFFDVDYWMFVVAFLVVGLLMFVRPFQVFVLTPILGARRPTPSEAAVIEPIWTAIAEANGLPA